MRLPLDRGTLLAALLLAGCSPKLDEVKTQVTFAADVHSYALPEEARVEHMDLDLRVDFDKKIIAGSVTHRVSGKDRLILDTKDLSIDKVESSLNGETFVQAKYRLGTPDKILGTPLEITLPADTRFVRGAV
jgi:leukotriene-A4 hydrolase